MTIATWVIFGIVAASSFFIALYSTAGCGSKKEMFIALLIAAGITAGAFIGLHWYVTKTEGGKRSLKTQQSSLGGGLKRTVTVYSYDGDKLRQWKGKFDVTEDDQETYFDVNGKRVIIQGGIIVNEEN
jgi:hypothetical protein